MQSGGWYVEYNGAFYGPKFSPITKTRQKNQDAWKKWNSERGISYGRTTKPMSIKKTSTTSSRSTRPAPPRKNVSQNPFSYDYGTSYSTTEKI